MKTAKGNCSMISILNTTLKNRRFMNAMENEIDKIVKKVMGLLAIAEDSNNDEEGQSAFMLAQKLMIKYKIDQAQIDSGKPVEAKVESARTTALKKILWWEKALGALIAENFRVKMYFETQSGGRGGTKRAIVFYGLEEDLKLAKEMYVIAYDALKHYANKYVDNFYKERQEDFDGVRIRAITTKLKDSYMLGFIDGLTVKFNEQRAQLTKEFALMVLTPKVVQDGYDNMFKDSKSKGVATNRPKDKYDWTYEDGYKDGATIDFTKSTIGAGDYSWLIGKIITFNDRGFYLIGYVAKIERDNLKMVILNQRLQGADSISPAVYDWSMSIEDEFAMATEEEIKLFTENTTEEGSCGKRSFDMILEDYKAA